jgi:hypothetical protein
MSEQPVHPPDVVAHLTGHKSIVETAQKPLSFALSVFAMINIIGTWAWAGFFKSKVKEEASALVDTKTIQVHLRVDGLEEHVVETDKNVRILIRMAEQKDPRGYARVKRIEESMPAYNLKPKRQEK